jgi:hypothetical protein
MLIINFDNILQDRSARRGDTILPDGSALRRNTILCVTNVYTGEKIYIKKKDIKRLHEKYHIILYNSGEILSGYTYANKSEHILRTLILKYNKQNILDNIVLYLTPETPCIFINEYSDYIIKYIITDNVNRFESLRKRVLKLSKYCNLDLKFWTKCLIKYRDRHGNETDIRIFGEQLVNDNVTPLFEALIRVHPLCNEIYKWAESINYANINGFANQVKSNILLNPNANPELISNMLFECKCPKRDIEKMLKKYKYYIYSEPISTHLHNFYGTSIYWDINTFISNNDYKSIIKYSNIVAEIDNPDNTDRCIHNRINQIDRILFEVLAQPLSMLACDDIISNNIVNNIFDELDTLGSEGPYSVIDKLLIREAGRLPYTAFKYLIHTYKSLSIPLFNANIDIQVLFTRETHLTYQDFKNLDIDKFDLFTVFNQSDLNDLYTGFDDIERWLPYQIDFLFLSHPRITCDNLHQILDTIIINKEKYRIGNQLCYIEHERQRFNYIIKNPNLRYSHLKKIIKYIYAHPDPRLSSAITWVNIFANPNIPNNKIIKYLQKYII